MNRKSIFGLGVYVLGIITIVTFAACTGGGGGSPSIPSIMSPNGMSNTSAAAKNNEGVDHLVQGHWNVAIDHLKEAISAKPDFAEAHFNLAVALDGKGKHADATEAFKKAQEFGGDNPKITGSEILKKHLNM